MPPRLSFLLRPYTLCPQVDLPMMLDLDPPVDWIADPEKPLDEALPFPWDHDYPEVFHQDFQPALAWRNACALCRALDATPPGSNRHQALRQLLATLVARQRAYLVQEGGALFVENRFEFRQVGVFIPKPWVSGIANAFALLTAVQIEPRMPELGLIDDIRGLADAFAIVLPEGQRPPARWITYRDSAGYLWFEEYPMPGGKPNFVLNGHIFAVLALFKAHGLLPGRGYDLLAKAGAMTVEENAPLFRRKGKTNIYSLRGHRKGDYLPERTVRQQLQLYMLTGSARFLAYARAFRTDMETVLDPSALALLAGLETHFIAARQRVEHVPDLLRTRGLAPQIRMDWQLASPTSP